MKAKLIKIKELIEGIKRDCKSLQKKGQLSERGYGQLDVVKLIQKILKE